MHPRQRSPRGFYPSDYRHPNRDAAFPRPKSFSQPPPPPPPPSRRGGDIFLEAGRLAAEYLVSQGLLQPNVLSLNWHNNNSFKKEIPVVDYAGRTSALARLGSSVAAAADGPSGRRKLGFDEFGQKGSRRRGGSFRNNNNSNGLEWGREFRRNGSWSDRFRSTPDLRDEDEDDSVVHRLQDEQQHQQQVGVVVGGESVSQKSNSNETVPRLAENGGDMDVEAADKDRVSGESLESKRNSPGVGKDTCNIEVEEVVKKDSHDLENVSGRGVKEVKEGTCDDGDHDAEKSAGVSKNLSVQPISDQESNASSMVFPDLLSLCKSAKVPTRARSLRVPKKNLKDVPPQSNGDENNTHEAGDLQGPEDNLAENENESVKGSSSGDLLSDKTYDLEHRNSEIAKVEPVHDVVEDMKDLDTVCNPEEDQSVRSQSDDQDKGYMHDNNNEASTTLPEYGSCSSMTDERGEKRSMEVDDDDDVREETKRMREWLPSLVPPRTEEYFLHNSNLIGIKESLGEDEISHIDKVNILTSDQGNLMSSSPFAEVGDRPYLPCSEEKQSLPSSFRTCDLNLMEASEVHESHTDHPILIYPPGVSETKKAVPVDIDLSTSHATGSGKFSTHATNGKEIEVIDLENDSAPEEKTISNMERKTDTMFPGLEGFSNHAPNTADIHDVQDGFGLMISEFLGTDFPNCSSVSSDMNSVHSEMALHNATGTLTEDDSIYMSLGEIPLSFLRTWEQPPPQDYQKPF